MVTSKMYEKVDPPSLTVDNFSNINDKSLDQVDTESPPPNTTQKSPSIFTMHSTISSFIDRRLKWASKCLGMLLAAASGLLLTLYSALYKTVKSEIDNSTVLMLRGVIQVFIMIVIIAVRRVDVAPKNMAQKTTLQRMTTWTVFICVCLFGGIRLCFIFAALEKIPMALVHTILNGSPVLVMVLSHFFLKDPCNLLRTACTFGLVAGVILIFQPQELLFATTTQVHASNLTHNTTSDTERPTSVKDDCKNATNHNDVSLKTDCVNFMTSKVANDLVGYAFSVGALVLSALGSVLTKKITQQFDKMVIALYLGISIGIVGWLQLMIFEPKAPTSPETFYPWFVAVIVGCLGVAQQFCLIAALKIESPTRVTVIRSLQIIVSFIVQIQAWDEHPGVDQICGAIVVVAAICIVALEDPILRKIKSCCSTNKTCACCCPLEPEPEVIINKMYNL